MSKVAAILLDWAGTVIDPYVMAPAKTFVEVFRLNNIIITMEEARGPMGLRKDLHIAELLLRTPEIRKRWVEYYHRQPDDNDVQRLYEQFIPLQIDCLPQHAELIPGVATTIQHFQQAGIKIGTTTGYNHAMAEVLLKHSIPQGYRPDVVIAGDDVEHGARPNPHMIYKNMDLLDIQSIKTVVHVDDTASGCISAHNAGCWSVGVSRYSNYMNINSDDEAVDLAPDAIEERHQISRQKLFDSGAHFVIDCVADLPHVINEINQRLANGQKP